MIIHNPILTGSFTVNGTDVASITSSAASITAINAYTASQNILNGTYTLTSSFAAQTASFTAFTSSVNSFTASQLVLNGTYATTGSNTFAGIQTVNSNLVVTGSITAQTLVVQTITSSVDFVTGSTRFGSILGNTHVFSGSVTMNPGGLFVSSSGLVGIGNIVPAYNLDVAGTGRFTTGVNMATISGNVGIGMTSPVYKLDVSDAIRGLDLIAGGTTFSYDGTVRARNASGNTNVLLHSNGNSYINAQTGSVGIGITNPAAQVQIYGTSTIANANLDGARLLLGTVTEGIGIDSNEIRSKGSSLAIGTIDNFPVVIGSNATNVLYVTGSNVGIGTASPTGLLDVASRGITKGSMPAGTVLQVIQTFKSDMFSIASGTPTDITGFSASITPTSSTSKILIFTTIQSMSDSFPYPKLILYRNSTAISLGTAGSNTSKISVGASQYSGGSTPALYSSVQIYLDSPATTSSVTYKWQAYTFDAPNRTWYMNRTSGDVDTNNQSAPSTITLMEIAQ